MGSEWCLESTIYHWLKSTWLLYAVIIKRGTILAKYMIVLLKTKVNFVPWVDEDFGIFHMKLWKIKSDLILLPEARMICSYKSWQRGERENNCYVSILESLLDNFEKQNPSLSSAKLAGYWTIIMLLSYLLSLQLTGLIPTFESE